MLTNNALRSVRFVLRPSCEHFFEMTKMLHNNDKKWDKVMGWGHELPYWLSASDKKMRPGWDFFDARGNQVGLSISNRLSMRKTN